MSGGPLLFLSHSGADTEPARELKRRLLASPEAKAANLAVWFDKDDLVPGNWQEQLEDAIARRSTAFAVVVGTKGVVNWVDREVRLALTRATEDRNYPFIPVLTRPELYSSLPPFARQFQGAQAPLEDEQELGKLLRAVLGGSDAVGYRRPVKLTGSPFVGLRAMTEADADLFFGREAEVEALVETVQANRLVAVVADSGAGKSSLVMAGLIPRVRGGALQDRWVPDQRVWQVVVMRPGGDPVENLRVGITQAAERLGLDGETRAALRRRIDPGRTDEWIYALQCDLPVKETETLLIVDQFEELLTQTPVEKRKPFIDWLMEITTAAIPVRVVLTLRADYFNLCSPYDAFYDRIRPGSRTIARSGEAGTNQSPHFRLKGLTERGDGSDGAAPAGSKTYSGLAAIVCRPLILAGHDDEKQRDALLKAIRRDVSDRPGDLALVQMALFETWRESNAGRDNLVEAYSRVGGVAGALAHAAEEVRKSNLSEGERELLEPVLARLVALGDTGGATRRIGAPEEFDGAKRDLAEKLTTEQCGRLLLAGTDSVEICHEHLITQWPWWQNCINAAASDMRRLARLISRAADWSVGKRARRYLATGAELGLFNDLARRRPAWLAKPEAEFVRRSALWAKIRQVSGIAAILLLVVAGALTTWQYFAATSAKNAAVANETRALAALSDTTTPGSINAFKLALAAWPRSAKDQRPRLTRTANALSRAMSGPFVLLPDLRHEGAVWGAVFDKAETRILSWSEDGTVRLWDAATGTPRGAPMKHQGRVQGAVFDKVETRILSWSDDKTVRLWDAATGEPRGAPMKHEGPVRGAMFDKAETRILSWSRGDGTVRLWAAATGEPRGAPMKHDDPVSGAMFDKAETRILSWSEDRTVRLWDAATGEPRGAPMKHEGRVSGAVFDTAETRILSWSSDGTVRLWDVARLGPGNLVEAACRLLPDKGVSTLRSDFGIDVTEPICGHDGKSAPAPDFRELVD